MGATLYAPFGSVPATRKAEGMRFTQALPEACLPIVRGEIVRPLDRLGG